jgi:hypothetical protein
MAESARNRNIENEETGFLHSTNFKLVLQIEGNSIKFCDYTKFIISLQAIVLSVAPGA